MNQNKSTGIIYIEKFINLKLPLKRFTKINSEPNEDTQKVKKDIQEDIILEIDIKISTVSVSFTDRITCYSTRVTMFSKKVAVLAWRL